MTALTESDVIGDVLKYEPNPNMCREVKTLADANTIAIGDLLMDNTLASTLKTRELSLPLTEGHPVATWKDSLPDAADATSVGLADAVASPLLGSTVIGSGTASASETCCFEVVVPDEYVAGSSFTVRIRAKESALSTVGATVDLTAKVIGDAGAGADICATAVQTLTAAYADYDFTITPTTLTPGAKLLLTITLVRDDTGGAVTGAASIVDVSCVYGVEATYSYVTEVIPGYENDAKYVALEAVTTDGATDSILVLARDAIVDQSQLNTAALTAATARAALTRNSNIIVRQEPTKTSTQTT